MKSFLFLLFLAILCLSGNIYYHELAHQEIWRSYGIDSKIKLSFPDAQTVTETPVKEYYEKCNEECKLAHNFNEVIGYHVMWIIIGMFFIALFLYIEIKLIYYDLLNRLNSKEVLK